MSIESLEGTVDFLTVTTRSGCETQKLQRLAMRISANMPVPRPWRFLRYNGWYAQDGCGAGGVSFGQDGPAKGLMQVWGEISNRWFSEAAIGGEHKVTRCDYAVSILFSEPQPPVSELIKGLDSSLGVFSAVVPVSGAGGTLYVGSRSSERFGRLYDKGAQLKYLQRTDQGIPDRLYWRYEVEYKRSCAMAAVHALATTDREGKLKTILGNVYEFFVKAGVPIPSMDIDRAGYPLVKYAAIERSTDRTLQWLETQVSPALVRLWKAGLGESACLALGIKQGDAGNVFLDTEAPEVMCGTQDDFFDALQGGAGFDNVTDRV